MGRILELKNEMVVLEFSEYHYFDDVLSDLKLTPVSYIQLGNKYEIYTDLNRVVVFINPWSLKMFSGKLFVTNNMQDLVTAINLMERVFPWGGGTPI